MKITDVNKDLTYYVDTDKEDFPYYRTDVDGRHWENLMGESWESVYDVEELQKLFWEYKDQMNDEEELWIR
jgi:hypothetical protein